MEMVSLNNIWLKYRVEFKENGRLSREDFWALRGVQCVIKKGECVALLGENGAGKTTLLKIIAGMLGPDKGKATVQGRISVLMEIGAGFQKELTGRENIYLISSLFGITKEQIEAKYEDIVNFAGIGRFIDAPVKSYSQGMYMRLAFAIAIHVDPEILLVDDVFAVGDIYAQKKCINKMFELKQKGKTIIFVTHDIEMAKRLCSRGIFIREGSLVKDGPIEEVCSYYIESVGDKKGIAIVQDGQLGVIFNNGKLILRWKEKAITSNSAGHSRLISSGKEFLSTAAYWELSEGGAKNEIVAIGRWPDLPVSLRWKITILNEKEFHWEIALEGNSRLSIGKCTVDLMLKNEFTRWFSLDREEGFPSSFIHESRLDLTTVDDRVNKIIGLSGDDGKSDLFPTLLLERLQDDFVTICRVGNTGADLEARLIHFQPLLHLSEDNARLGWRRCFLSKISIFEGGDSSLKDYLDNAKKTKQELASISKGPLALRCHEKKIELYFNDKLITHSTGFNTRFKCFDERYKAQEGHWIIHKENSEEILVTIFWDRLAQLFQVWKLRLKNNNVIAWSIRTEISGKAKIREKQTELILSGRYRDWITPDEKGDFDGQDKQGKLGILNKYVNKYIGVEHLDDSEGLALPGVLFGHNGAAPLVSYLSQIKDDAEITRMFFVEIDKENVLDAESGILPYFEGEITVGTSHNKSEASVEEIDKGRLESVGNNDLAKIESARTALAFEHGKMRLFWEGTELTKKLGLYTSVQYSDIWCDSTQALWKIHELSKNKIAAVSSWPWIPLIQHWEITLLNEKTIKWNIRQKVWENFILQKGQVNLMLTDSYSEWFVADKIKGIFSNEFIEHNGIFWDRLWCGNTDKPIGAYADKTGENRLNKQSLPSVILDCNEGHRARYFAIENTDSFFQARVLQCETMLNNSSKNGETGELYFSGTVTIES
jgi:ABC-type polysaccharide/polyol phosphate transport system ATPase subunit